jgi:site-specific DNA recombinase
LPEVGTAITHLRDILCDTTYESLPTWVFDDYCRVIQLRLRPNRPCPSRIERCLETTSLADPEDLAREQDSDLAATARHAALQRQLSDANRKVAALIAALESGVAVADLAAALRRRTAERDELKARLERVERPRAMSAAQISELANDLGGLTTVLSDATAAERAEVYASLGLRLDYDPHLRRVKATADLSRVAGCVRGGT